MYRRRFINPVNVALNASRRLVVYRVLVDRLQQLEVAADEERPRTCSMHQSPLSNNIARDLEILLVAEYRSLKKE